MNVCTLICETCGVELIVARHTDTCDDPSEHGSIASLSAAHLAEHPEHVVTVQTETEAEYEARMTAEADQRAADAAATEAILTERAAVDRERMAQYVARVQEQYGTS